VIYKKYLSGVASTVYDQYLHDAEVLDLSDEMKLLKAKLAEELASPDKKEHLARVKSTVDQIRKLSDTITKNMERARGYIPVSFLPVLTQQITELLTHEIKEQHVIARIRQRLGQLALPANSREARRAERVLEKDSAAERDS
jgi:hypothetical protein